MTDIAWQVLTIAVPFDPETEAEPVDWEFDTLLEVPPSSGGVVVLGNGAARPDAIDAASSAGFQL
jgi:gentisate 1,2-dioxygenase